MSTYLERELVEQISRDLLVEVLYELSLLPPAWVWGRPRWGTPTTLRPAGASLVAVLAKADVAVDYDW